MARVYLCGTFRFLSQFDKAEELLKDSGVSVCRSFPGDPDGIRGCLSRIDRSDNVYVINPEGYVGKSVALDIGYAYAKGKPIYSMEPIADPPIGFMVEKIVGLDRIASAFGGSEQK